MAAASASRPIAASDNRFEAARLEQLFEQCFAERWRTRLVGGAGEPYYQPTASAGGFHLLHYRSDYFASALHEIAHWCIAGKRRRSLPDFGYWYVPDGRSAQQQQAFQAAEAKPQALEWLFSIACGYRFFISADNLGAQDSAAPDNTPFKRQLLAQARHWQRNGLPSRARIFFDALAREFATGLQPSELDLQLTGLAG